MTLEQRIAVPLLAACLGLLTGCDNSPKAPNAGWGLGPGYYSPAAAASAEAEPYAQDICSRALSCGMESKYLKECITLMKAMVMYLPNPQVSVECLGTKTCPQDMESINDLLKILEACAKVDINKLRCSGASIQICDLQGNCVTRDCNIVCVMQGKQKGLCVKDKDTGFATCKCSSYKLDGGVKPKPTDMFVPPKG